MHDNIKRSCRAWAAQPPNTLEDLRSDNTMLFFSLGLAGPVTTLETCKDIGAWLRKARSYFPALLNLILVCWHWL